MHSKFIIVTYTTIPRNTKVTHVKGWRDTPNATQYNESIGFKNNISINDLQTAKLILNTKNLLLMKIHFYV